MIVFAIYVVGMVVTAYVAAFLMLREERKSFANPELDFADALAAMFFGLGWPVFVPFALLAWSLKEGVNKVLREVRK